MAEATGALYHEKQQYLLILDGAVLLTLSALVLYTISKHEPWADEAQAWLIARDFSWWHLVLHELRYEGHPVLWFAILSVAIHLFHMPYAYLGYLGSAFAIAGLVVLIFLAPFPRFLRYVVGFSFFFVYQYAVIARPYVLIPLLAFLAANCYRKGLSRITSFAIFISLLIQVSSYAAIIAFSLVAALSVQLVPRWRGISRQDRKRVFVAFALVACSAILFVAVLLPPSDSFLVAQENAKTLHQHVQLVIEGLVGALSDFTLVAVSLLVLVGVWAYQRAALLLFGLSVGATALEYGFVRGYTQHQGLITIAFVVFLWAVWPSIRQIESLPGRQKLLHQVVVGALVLTFAWQCTWSFSSIRNDWAGPYTGARDAAQFLQSVHADQLGCIGFGFWAVGVQPYFDHNIFLNYGAPESPASQHWSNDFYNRANVISQKAIQDRPAFILVADEESFQQVTPMIEGFKTWNYRLVHYSEGNRFFKNTKGIPSLYLIFQREDPAQPTQMP